MPAVSVLLPVRNALPYLDAALRSLARQTERDFEIVGGDDVAHDDMANERLIDSPLAHGTAMLRREWLDRVGGWAERGWAEDVDLWLRLFEAGARFGKRPEVLYAWRQHRASATRRDPRYARD